MANCVLDKEQLDLIIQHIYQAIKNTPEGKSFDYKAFMQSFYNELATEFNDSTAANYVMHVPELLFKIGSGTDINIFKPEEIGDLFGLSQEFQNPESVINKYKISEANQIKADFENHDAVVNAPVLIDVSKKSRTSGIKATEAFSGTLQTNKRGNKSLQSKEILEQPDPDFDNYRALLNRINSLENGALVDVNSVSIDGFQLHFKAQNFLMFGKEPNNEKLLAKADKNDLILSRTYLSGKITPDKNVTQANERVILILTDENGNRLYADKDGKLSTEKTLNNKLVYQFLRIVKKDGDKYNIVNMYGIGEQIAKPKNSEEYAIQQAEFEQLYKFQNQFTQPTTLNTTKKLPIVFFTRGQLSDNSFLIKDLIDKNDAKITNVKTYEDEKDIYVDVQVGELTLNGVLRTLQLRNIPNVLNMLVDAVADPNVSLEDKAKLLKQHITPNNNFSTLVNSIIYYDKRNIIYINRNNDKNGQKSASFEITESTKIDKEELKAVLENNFLNINKESIINDKFLFYQNNAVIETNDYQEFLINNADVNFYTQSDELANYSFIFNPNGETKPFTASSKSVAETFTEPVIETPLTIEQKPEIKENVNETPNEKEDYDYDDPDAFYRKGYSIEDINPEQVAEAKAWWNSKQMVPLRKLISFEKMDNLVNSNVFARFIVSASVLADGKMGKIQVNEKLGSAYDNLTIYHEAWHVFSQLFLSKQEKINLYNELKNFKDSKGNKPYADKSFMELEEMLAEDFRNYVKTGNVKKETPKRNSLFRRILNFLKALFSGNLKSVNSTDTSLDSLNSPLAKELFDKLYRGQFNDYTPSIDNRLYTAFDRGIEEVADKRNDILTPKESNDIAESIDNFVAEELNSEVKKAEDKYKAVVLLSMPKYRESLYNNARITFNQLLQKEKAEFEKRTNKPALDFNSLKTVEDLEENAVAVMRNKKGEHKYFFLTSQIENFKNLQPSYKRGDRVRGEEYKDTIDIVGDFFRHRNILVKDGRAADIVLVSNMEDAVKQFQNYLKGGSEVFTSLDTDPNNIADKIQPLSLEDEQRLNKIRRLQAVVDNWGDAESGVVKYHRSRTDFKLLKTDARDISSDDIYDSIEDEEDQTKTETIDDTLNGDKQGQTPLDKMLSKEVMSILKSLFAVDPNGNYSYDEYGFKKRAEFSYVFNIVAKTIGGIRDRQEAYNKLVEVSEKFPEIKQLVETKLASPDAIQNQFDLQLSTAFWQGFSKPRVKYMQLYAFLDKQTGKLDYRVKESSLTVNNIINKWAETFNSAVQTKANYVITDVDNNNTFNNEKFRNTYNKKEPGDTLDKKTIDTPEQKLNFLKNLGIQLDNNDNVKKAISEIDESSYGFVYKTVVKSNENPIEALKKEQSIFLKKLAEIQNKFGFDTASTGVLRANGNISYQELNWSSLHAKVDALNSVKTIGELWPDTEHGDDGAYGHMSYLNPEINPHTPFMKVFQSLFSTGDNVSNQRVRNSVPIEVVPIDGFSAEMSDGSNIGNTLTELDPLSKFYVEFNYMLIGGLQEFPRHSEKKFAMGAKFDMSTIGPLNQPKEYQDKNLFVGIKRFTEADPNSIHGGGNYAVKNFFLGYLNGEYNRILKFEHSPQKDELAKITGYNNKIQTAVGQKIAGKAFIIFDDMLSKNTLEKLYQAAEENKSFNEVLETLEQDITTDIRKYFYNKTKNLYDNFLSKLDYIPPVLLKKAGFPENVELTSTQKMLLLGAYLYNSYIHHVESNLLFHGDPAQWNHGKEEFHKRIPGLTSDGEGFLVDQNMIDYINNKFLGKKSYGKTLGAEYDNLKLGYTVNTAVIKDAERESIYLDDMIKAWKEEYQNRNLKPSQIEDLLAEDKKAYEKMKEGDGFAYMTFDAYRMLKKAQNTWTFEQEQLYTKIINGESVDPKDVKNFFPVYKLHYYGAIKNDYYPVTGMHKFAVIPLIPGVNAKEGSELYKLHKQMLKENIVYTTFASGSKGANLTSDGKVDDVFAKDSKDKLFKDNVTFTKNPIYLANLKEVTKINDYYKESLPIATQTRGIIIDNLFKDGELVNKNNAPVVDEYLKSVKEYTNVLKEALLNNVGIEFVDGRTVGNLSEFINLVRSELKSRELPEHLIKLINTDLKGNLSFDFSLHPENDGIEKLLMSYIQKGLIKQKTAGEPLVQTPSTFTQGLWDSGLTPITESEIKEQLGTNTLPFYITEIVDGKRQRTTEMKVAIALQGPFLNLLNATDLEGNRIGTIDKLNELIKNPEWFAKNKKSLTIFGPRIPNDATNTIEAATVYHFLDPSFGNSIILPTEIVAKAGSDFDADKLFMVFPNIDNNGEYVNKGVDGFKTKLSDSKALNKREREKQNLPSPAKLIEQQMMFLQNKFQAAAVEILMLPENYAYLTRPNGMYLVTKYVDKLKDKNAYDRFRNVNGFTRSNISPTRIFDADYNLYKFDANLSLEPSLGILAKLSKSHPIFKSVGAKMPSTYRLSGTGVGKYKGIEAPVFMPFKTNTVKNKEGKEVISLAGETTELGTRISDLISHNLQGVLDRAKESFPFDLKLIPEAMDVLSYMIQAGVNEETMFLFVNHPIIAKYFNKQRVYSSSVSKAISLFQSKKDDKESKKSPKAKALTDVLNGVLDGVKDAELNNILKNASKLKLEAVVNSLQEMPNVDLTVKLEGQTELKTIKAKDLSNYITSIKSIKDKQTGSEIYTEIDKKSLTAKKNYVFVTQALNNEYLNNNEISQKSLSEGLATSDTTSLKALTIFMNFYTMEEQYSGIKNLQLNFSPDTQKITTIQQLKARVETLRELKGNTLIDQDFYDKLLKDSVISSFVQDQVIAGLMETVFKFKLNSQIINYIDNALNRDYAKQAQIRAKYRGLGIDQKESFIKQFNNAVINYMLQNYLSKQILKTSENEQFPLFDNFNNLPVVEVTAGDVVTIDSTVQVNKGLMLQEYNSLSPADRILFSEFSIYQNFKLNEAQAKLDYPVSTAKELSVYKLYNQTLTDEESYQKLIREIALMKSFNPSYALGTRQDASFTSTVMNAIQILSEETKFEFSILKQLAPKTVKSKNGVTNKVLVLNNKKEVEAQLANNYNSQLKRLGDKTVNKANPFDNIFISDIFNHFSMMMYYQHGVGKTTLGFVKALDSAQYKEQVTKFTVDFTEKFLQSDVVLGDIFKNLIGYSKIKNYTVLDTLSDSKLVETEDGVLEEFDWDDSTPSTPIEEPTQSSSQDTSVSTPVANIPQNKVSGVESYGSTITANNEVVKALGSNPHSIDMIEAGFRTRTTRSESEMAKYAVKVGDVIKHFGTSANGTTKNILARVTAIHPKGSAGWKGTWEKEGWRAQDVDVIDRFKGGAAAIEFEVIKPTEVPVSQTNKPKGEEIKPGIYVNQGALTKEEQIELFDYLKPYLEEQAAKTNKGVQASKMIGLGLRWDYKNNNVGKRAVEIPDVINPGNKTKYGYYDQSINGQSLGEITPRFRELMQKATGVDMTNYDGAIINLYEKDTFISSHNDVDESKSAIKYPVIGINLGGKGNFSIERLGPENAMLDLQAGTGYVFGVDGINREVWHRTFPTPQDSFLPELTTKIDGKTYPAGSYRVTITMRRVMPLTEGMPEAPSVVSTQSSTQPAASIKNFLELYTSEEQNNILKSLRNDPAFKGLYTTLSDIELIERINLKLNNPEKRNAVLELLNNCLK